MIKIYLTALNFWALILKAFKIYCDDEMNLDRFWFCKSWGEKEGRGGARSEDTINKLDVEIRAKDMVAENH